MTVNKNIRLRCGTVDQLLILISSQYIDNVTAKRAIITDASATLSSGFSL